MLFSVFFELENSEEQWLAYYDKSALSEIARIGKGIISPTELLRPNGIISPTSAY